MRTSVQHSGILSRFCPVRAPELAAGRSASERCAKAPGASCSRGVCMVCDGWCAGHIPVSWQKRIMMAETCARVALLFGIR